MARRPRIDRELERYLVADELVIVAIRKHWFHLFRELCAVVGATVLAFWVDLNVPLTPGGELLHNLSWLVWWISVGWLVWEVLNWRRDWFVATDKRFLLFFGFIRRKVAMMPLLKVTDMTYDRSLLGRIVGFGTFILESAGQQQAMSKIDHVPHADQHYKAICTQLFGPGSQIRLQSAGGFPSGGSFRPPPDDWGGPPGGGGDPGLDPYAGGPAPAAPAPPAAPVPVPATEGTEGTRAEPDKREDRDKGDQRDEREGGDGDRAPESWYRSSNAGGPSRLGDTGEIPVVHVPPDGEDEEPRLYPPRHWLD